MTFDITHEIAGRVSPKYWGGHSLGIGDVTPLPHPYNTKRGAFAAGHMIQAYILGGKQVLEGTPFDAGETFNVSEHAPGTVVILQYEDLHTHDDIEPLNLLDFKDVQIPGRPLLHEELDLATEGLHYVTAPLISAVAKSGFRGQHVLYASPYSSIEKHGDHVRFKRGIGVDYPQVTVGEVIHAETNHLTRVTALRIYTPTKRERSFFSGIVFGRPSNKTT